MADTKFQLRCYSYLDRMQPQYAAFVGTITQGDLPTEGMASLYIEVAPGNEVFQLVDIAVKSTEARPGAQIVDREFGMFEVHSRAQAEVLEAGRIVLDRLGLTPEDRLKPEIASVQVITNVDPYQAQLLNRFRRGSMLVPGETMLVLECAPAAYINYACNEAEKGATIKLLHVSSVGRFGRMWLSGSEAEIGTRRATPRWRLWRRWKVESEGREARMPKAFYTERDIDDLHTRGVTSIDVHDDVVLTDLARERALKLGVRLNRVKLVAHPAVRPAAHPEGAAEAELVQRIKAAVLARLGERWVDPAVLDAVVRRVVKEIGA